MAKQDKRIKYVSDTEKPVMVSVRLPRELYDRLERYGTQYRQSISELVKDGIEMRLEVEADPRSRRAESTTDEPLEQIDGASILRDMQATLARHETQMAALTAVIERQTTPAGNGAYDSNTEIAPSAPPVAMTPKMKVDKEEVLVRIQQMREGGLDSTQITKSLQAEGVPTLSGDAQLQAVVDMLEPIASMEAQSTLIQPLAGEDTRESMPPYDPTKYRLGKLCPSKHEWGSTGKSRLKTSGSCPMCEADRKRDKRAREKAEREAQPVAG